jgi:flagellar motor switch protein FliN/FliY
MASTFTVGEYADAFVSEFSTALQSVLGGSVRATGGPATTGDGWAVTCTAAGALTGTVTTWVDRSGGALLAQRLTGAAAAPDDAIVCDMLKEMWSQAAGTLSTRAPFTGVTLAVGTPVLAAADRRQLTSYTLTFAADATARIAVTADVAGADVAASRRTAAADVEAEPAALRRSPAASANLDVVLDIDLPLVVRFGKTQMTLKTLAALGPGSILDMGRSPDEPVEILVGEQVIARGEVVIVSGNYGVRITDLVSPADRVRAMEA